MKSRWLHWLGMLLLTAAVLLALAWLAWPLLKDTLGQAFARAVVANPMALLDAGDKERIYQKLAADLPGIYEAVPEARVGKLLQKNIRKNYRGAEVATNNAGFRDDRNYTAKPAGVYRIVCLGDSFVEGTGGRVEDRFCNQLQDILNEQHLLGEGVSAETYALGVGSWNAVNAASYMISHLSAYEPDLIIVLLVSNDMADGQGVNGIGAASNEFSPQSRSLGSGVFSDIVASQFAAPETYLLYDLGPESVSRWELAFSLYRRLEALQVARGGEMMFSVLNSIPLFSELARKYHAKSGMTSPFLVTHFFPDEQTRLPHDSHPSRAGHRVIASHYVHAMAQQGWISAPDEGLLPLHSGLELATPGPADRDFMDAMRKEIAADFLPREIEFDDLSNLEIQAFLGGIWPDPETPIDRRRGQFPAGTTKTGFFLAREEDARRVAVEVFVPPKPELYPNTIRLYVNGRLADSLTLDSIGQAGEKELSAELGETGDERDILEIMLTSETWWSGITDNTMRSYELRRAWQSR